MSEIPQEAIDAALHVQLPHRKAQAQHFGWESPYKYDEIRKMEAYLSAALPFLRNEWEPKYGDEYQRGFQDGVKWMTPHK